MIIRNKTAYTKGNLSASVRKGTLADTSYYLLNNSKVRLSNAAGYISISLKPSPCQKFSTKLIKLLIF
jgi:hypothetical protein